MYVTTPPRRKPGGTRSEPFTRFGPLRLARIEGRVFAEAAGPYPDEDRSYFTDLMASYDLTCSEPQLAAGRTTFRTMLEALLPGLRPFADRFDLAVLAHSTPDAEPGWPMCYLSEAVPDAGLAFAVSDQGLAAPFTALRLAADGVSSAAGQRALVIVMDQAAVLHDEPVPARLRARLDSAVVMVFDEDGGQGTLSGRCLAGVAESEVPARMAVELDELSAPGTALTVICGAGLSGYRSDRPGVEFRYPRPGLPCTGIWESLAGALSDGDGERRRIVVADYDESLRYLCTCVVDTPEGQP